LSLGFDQTVIGDAGVNGRTAFLVTLRRQALEPIMSFIWTYTKNNITYAEVRTSERQEAAGLPKSHSRYLGKVIDLEKGIFQNRKLGVFKYSADSGYDASDLHDTSIKGGIAINEKEILDFGASYLLEEFSKKIGFWNLFRETLPEWNDTLMALVFYHIETSSVERDALRWFRGSFSNMLFPAAQLSLRSIGDFLSIMGDESVQRNFFSKYLKIILPQKRKKGIIVDGTGFPNSIHFPLKATGNHNGETHREAGLIFVVDAETGMPLLFKHDAGNTVDMTTLEATTRELEEYGINVKYAILDAGYCSKTNIAALRESGINFLIGLPDSGKIFTNAHNEYKTEALSDFCRYAHNDGIAGIKTIETQLYGFKGYVYLCVDYDARNDQIKQFTKEASDDNIPRSEWESQTDKMGFFALISSLKIEPGKLLPLYHTRRTALRIFDTSKILGDIIPFDTNKEEKFGGHVMISFMAKILWLKLNQCFKGHDDLTADGALMEMKNLKCKIFDDRAHVKEPTELMREICAIAGIDLPERIPLPILRS
jgi:hypothetical protein